jgi:crotonobetainyl-CoA:carnitine CoA-transferase CaiB-like acyl-CoA transferase
MATEPIKHILDGYKVLDFTQVLAGPTVTRLMAEMGAEIIKVELLPGGDFSRGFPFFKDGRSAYYVQQNRGKKSLAIDAKKPEGLAILKELLPKVDVLVQNFAPGVIDRLGLSYDAVKAINPRIIMCSVSAFGQTGPLSAEPGYDYIAQAYAGVTYMIGEPDGPPFFPMLGLGDVSTGAHAMGAIACALLYRERTGQGQHLDIALIDCYFHCHEMNVQVYSVSGGAIKPKRSGAHHPQICPCGIFHGKEAYVFIIAFLDHQWAKLCEVMGRPELINDPRMNSSAKRLEHLDLVSEAIQSWLASAESDEAAINALRAARIPVAPVLSIEQAVNHPHFKSRHTVRKIHDRVLGEFDAPGFPLKFSAFPGELALEAAFLGEHNAEVLSKYLGYGADRVKDLEAKGILGKEPVRNER